MADPKEERIENLKKHFDSLVSLPEEQKISEYASLVYAKVALEHILLFFQDHYKEEADYKKDAEANPFVKKVGNALSAYGAIGFELGFAGKLEEKQDDAE